MANFVTIWNTQTILQAAEQPPQPVPIGTQTGCSIRINNNTQYGVQVLQGTSVVDYILPNSHLVMPMANDYTVALDTTLETQNVPANPNVTYSILSGVQTYSNGSTNFTGTTQVNITNSTIDIGEVQGTVDANITNSQLSVQVENETLDVSGSSVQITGGTIEANITNATIPVSGSVEIVGTPEVNLSSDAAVNIANTPTVNIGNSSIAVTNESGGTLTVAGEVNIAGTPSVEISGTPTVAIANNQSINVESMPALEIADNQSVSISGTPNVAISGTPTVEIAAGSVVNANVQNESINSNVVNEFLAVSNFILLGSATAVTTALTDPPESVCEVTFPTPAGMSTAFDTFYLVVKDLTNGNYYNVVDEARTTLQLLMGNINNSMLYPQNIGNSIVFPPASYVGENLTLNVIPQMFNQVDIALYIPNVAAGDELQISLYGTVLTQSVTVKPNNFQPGFGAGSISTANTWQTVFTIYGPLTYLFFQNQGTGPMYLTIYNQSTPPATPGTVMLYPGCVWELDGNALPSYAEIGNATLAPTYLLVKGTVAGDAYSFNIG